MPDSGELPSQIMEHWAMAPEVLKVYARQYQTGEPIPDELIARIEKSSTFNQGFIQVRSSVVTGIHCPQSIKPASKSSYRRRNIWSSSTHLLCCADLGVGLCLPKCSPGSWGT